MVKNLPAMQATWTQFLDRDHPLEKEMATHSSILTWRIPWTEKPGSLHEVSKSLTQLTLSFFIFILLIFESLIVQLKILIYLLATNNCNI